MARQEVNLTEQVQGILPTANGGTGASSITGAGIFDTTSVQTGTNKAFTNPKINNGILDTNGNSMIGFNPAGSAVNYFTLQNGSTGNGVWLYAVGADPNVTLVFNPQGAGSITGWANSQAAMVLSAAGSATDVGWNLTTQGAGLFQINGTPIIAGMPNVFSANVSIPANYSCVRTDYVEIASGVTLEVGAGAYLDIT